MAATRSLNLRLFGLLSVQTRETDGRTAVLPLSGRPASLLAFLALEPGRFFPRCDIQAFLWSDRCDDVAAGALNTALWRLRRAVEKPPSKAGSVIACDHRGAMSLSLCDEIMVDVKRFEALTSAGLAKSADRLDPLDVSGMREGVAMYSADVLSGFTDEWALRARERHRLQYLNALDRLMHVSALAADFSDAIKHGQAILDHDALREDVHRHLMNLFVANGQRTLALRQFEVCRDALRRELAISPMRETLELYRRLAEESSPPKSALHEITDLFSADSPKFERSALSARECIDAARSHLQIADERLGQALSGLNKPTP